MKEQNYTHSVQASVLVLCYYDVCVNEWTAVVAMTWRKKGENILVFRKDILKVPRESVSSASFFLVCLWSALKPWLPS